MQRAEHSDLLKQSAEYKLLLGCARRCVDEVKAEQIRVLARGRFDWEFLLRAALWHGIAPLLYWNLTKVVPDEVPPDITKRLRILFDYNLRRNLYLTAELHRVLKLLADHGVDALAFKGPALAVAAYGNLGLRQFEDLDLLVEAGNVTKAQELLETFGYRLPFQLSPAQRTACLRSQKHFRFISPETEIALELHWRVDPQLLVPLDFSFLSKRREHVVAAGHSIPTLLTADALLVCSVHGCNHLWGSLGWISDVAELLGACKDQLNWPNLLELSRACGSKRMLFIGLLLAWRLLDAPLPAEVRGQIQSDPEVERLANRVEAVYLQPCRSPVDELERSAFHLRSRERLAHRFSYCVQLATDPAGEWTHFRLPDPLFPLYRVLRPVRLSAKHGRKLLRKVCNGYGYRRG